MGILEQAKAKMAAAIEHFKNELKQIRTGRANPGMVEHVLVESHGMSRRLKEVASISVLDTSQLLISPFDAQQAASIGKAIEKANIGLTPIVDGKTVRLKIPPMTEEFRKKMAKLCHEECEKAKVSIRNSRQEANKEAKKEKAEGKMAEDAVKKLEKGIQELTDKHCQEAVELLEKKEKELSTI